MLSTSALMYLIPSFSLNDSKYRNTEKRCDNFIFKWTFLVKGTDSDEEGEIKTSSVEEGELDENGNAERRARKRTKKVRGLSKDASDSDDESPEKKPKKHRKKKKHKDATKKRRKVLRVGVIHNKNEEILLS